MRGKGKIVTKKWIEACFIEQKKLPWRRFALDRTDKDEPESEEEIHNVLVKKSPSTRKFSGSGSDDDMVVVDKRLKNCDVKKTDEPRAGTTDESEPVNKPDEIEEDVQPHEIMNIMDVSTDDEMMIKSSNGSEVELMQLDIQIYKGKTFYLNEDLPATDVIKLKNQISTMMGKITDQPSKANFIITEKGRRLPAGVSAEILISLWVYECFELEALIPTTRYRLK